MAIRLNDLKLVQEFKVNFTEVIDFSKNYLLFWHIPELRMNGAFIAWAVS